MVGDHPVDEDRGCPWTRVEVEFWLSPNRQSRARPWRKAISEDPVAQIAPWICLTIHRSTRLFFHLFSSDIEIVF
jgi:hypothetical protein